MKKVVIYWCDFRGKQNDLLAFLGSKKKVYLEVFNEISKEAELALVFGGKNYLGGLKFKNYYSYENGDFFHHRDIITADAVLDRSRSLKFPRRSKKINQKVLNQLDFKQMVGDKWVFYKSFRKYSPRTYLCSSSFFLNSILKKFKEDEKIVIKPRYGMKGLDILINNKSQIDKSKIKYPVVIQEFIETKDTFLKDSRSDVRLVIIDGIIIYALVRKPKKGSLLANVARGGSIDEVRISDLPKDLIKIANKIATEIKNKYNNPFYSIDFGITKTGFVIFEMNNFIGFPLITRQKNNLFINKLARVLIEKTKI
jgi:glutathione synthase/RimK-type ligase-like ATP-grasp enzyme